MIGSPNYVRFVYDGDNSSVPGRTERGGRPRPALARSSGCSTTTSAASGWPPRRPRSADARTTARSSRQGIPAGGLFTGAEGVKTAEQAAIYGGTAGEQYDHCYHLACDTIVNVNRRGDRRDGRRGRARHVHPARVGFVPGSRTSSTRPRRSVASPARPAAVACTTSTTTTSSPLTHVVTTPSRVRPPLGLGAEEHAPGRTSPVTVTSTACVIPSIQQESGRSWMLWG